MTIVADPKLHVNAHPSHSNILLPTDVLPMGCEPVGIEADVEPSDSVDVG